MLSSECTNSTLTPHRDSAASFRPGFQDRLRQGSGRRGRVLHGEGGRPGGRRQGVLRRVCVGKHLHPVAGGDDRDGHLRRAERVGSERNGAQRPAPGVHPGAAAAQILHLQRLIVTWAQNCTDHNHIYFSFSYLNG